MSVNLTEKNNSEIIEKGFIFLNEYYWVLIIIVAIWIIYKFFDKSSIKIGTKDKTITVGDISDTDGNISIGNDKK